MRQLAIFFVLFFIIFAFSFANVHAAGIIPCEGVTPGQVGTNAQGQPIQGYVSDCDFADLVRFGANIINFLIMLSIPLAVIAFMWAGILMLTAGGNQSQISKAKGIFWTVLKGFIFVLCAWLIVYTITTALLNPDRFTNLLG